MGKHIPRRHQLKDEEAYSERRAIMEVEQPDADLIRLITDVSEQSMETPFAKAVTAAYYGDWLPVWLLLRRGAHLGDDIAAATLADIVIQITRDRAFYNALDAKHGPKPRGHSGR